MARRALRLLVAVTLSAGFSSRAALALETDQFTVPDRPLMDIGRVLDARVHHALAEVIEEANREWSFHARESRNNPIPFLRDYHRRKAASALREEHLARQLFVRMASFGGLECNVEHWVRGLDSPSRQVLHKLAPDRTVYGGASLTNPILWVGLSPTVKVHGCYMGNDKIGHFFSQGYDYYKVFRKEELRGNSTERAFARAVALGVKQEKGMYGERVIGIYSNADLAANFAGLKFYLNLTRPVVVNGSTVPPVLVSGERGGWVFNPAREGLLTPLISDHFNEALNPSRYEFKSRGQIRSNLRRRAGAVVAFYSATPDTEAVRANYMAAWFGEDYGHSGIGDLITIANTCFPR